MLQTPDHRHEPTVAVAKPRPHLFSRKMLDNRGPRNQDRGALRQRACSQDGARLDNLLRAKRPTHRAHLLSKVQARLCFDRRRAACFGGVDVGLFEHGLRRSARVLQITLASLRLPPILAKHSNVPGAQHHLPRRRRIGLARREPKRPHLCP